MSRCRLLCVLRRLSSLVGSGFGLSAILALFFILQAASYVRLGRRRQCHRHYVRSVFSLANSKRKQRKVVPYGTEWILRLSLSLYPVAHVYGARIDPRHGVAGRVHSYRHTNEVKAYDGFNGV